MSTNTKRIGTPLQFEELSRLAGSIVSQCEQVRKLALELGEIGTSREAESTSTVYRQLAAVSAVRAGEARLASGELVVAGPNATDAIYASIDYWRAVSTKSAASEQLSTMHRDAAVKAGRWAKLDENGQIVDESMVTPGILAEMEVRS